MEEGKESSATKDQEDAIFNGERVSADSPISSQSISSKGSEIIVENDISNILDLAHSKGMEKFIIFLHPGKTCVKFNNAFVIKKSLLSKISARDNICEMRISRGGSIVIKTFDVELAKELVNVKEILGISFTASIDNDTLFSKFIIHNVEPEYSLEEIVDDLKKQDILPTRLKRFLKKSTEGYSFTRSVLVTQIGEFIPMNVKIFFERCNVSKFLDKPRQCANCWLFGHSEKTCRSKKICRFCGENQEGSTCLNNHSELKCRNCSEQHPASDENCSARTTENIIYDIKNERLISRHDAVHLYRETNYNRGKASYSKTVNSQSSIDIQTNMLENRIRRLEVDLDNKFRARMENYQQEIFAFISKALGPIYASLPTVKGYNTLHENDLKIQSDLTSSSRISYGNPVGEVSSRDHSSGLNLYKSREDDYKRFDNLKSNRRSRLSQSRDLNSEYNAYLAGCSKDVFLLNPVKSVKQGNLKKQRMKEHLFSGSANDFAQPAVKMKKNFHFQLTDGSTGSGESD